MDKAREPLVAYQPAIRARGRPTGRPVTESARAKVFVNGRSQAVRLPKEFRMPGTEVLIHREGNRIVLEPLTAPALDEAAWLADLDRVAATTRPDPKGGTLADILREMRKDER